MSESSAPEITRKIFIQTSIPGAEPLGFYEALEKEFELTKISLCDSSSTDSIKISNNIFLHQEEQVISLEGSLANLCKTIKSNSMIYGLDMHTPVFMVRQRLFLRKQRGLLNEKFYEDSVSQCNGIQGMYYPRNKLQSHISRIALNGIQEIDMLLFQLKTQTGANA